MLFEIDILFEPGTCPQLNPGLLKLFYEKCVFTYLRLSIHTHLSKVEVACMLEVKIKQSDCGFSLEVGVVNFYRLSELFSLRTSRCYATKKIMVRPSRLPGIA